MIAFAAIIAVSSGHIAYQQADLRRQREITSQEKLQFDRRITELKAENQRLADEIAQRRSSEFASGVDSETIFGRVRQRAVRMQALKAIVDHLADDSGNTNLAEHNLLRLMFGVANPAVISGPGMYQFGWSKKLPDGFARLFDLNSEEEAELNATLAETVEAVEATVRQLTFVREGSPGNWVLTTGSSKTGGNDRANAFMAKFYQVLGPDGYDAFARLNGESQSQPGTRVRGGPQDFFDGFGYYGHVIVVRRTDDGHYRYSIDWTGGPGDGPGRSLTGSGASNYAELREELGIFGQMLPETEPTQATVSADPSL